MGPGIEGADEKLKQYSWDQRLRSEGSGAKQVPLDQARDSGREYGGAEKGEELLML